MSIADERNAKEGFLSWKPALKKGKFKEQHFVLRENHLFWFRNAAEASKTRYDKVKKTGKAVLHLKGARVQPSADPAADDNQFLLTVVNGDQYVLVAPDSDTATDWIELIKEASQGAEISREMVEITQRLRRAGHDIPPDDLDFDDSAEVGRGASGIVRKGSWLRSPVAVKALGNVPEFTDPKELIQFYKEIETLSKLRSPYVVQMFGFSKKDGFLCLVTEFVGGGNLARQLEDVKNFLDDALKVEFGLNIARGMIFLHNIGLIHRDLKPANVLIESWNDGKVKICDFGLSTISTQKKSVRPREPNGATGATGAPAGDPDDDDEVVFGSPQYAAPELRSETHTEKVDVFSFAIILWQVDNRKVPWTDELQWAGQYAERYENGQRPQIPVSCVYTQLIRLCWAQDPTARPAFKEIFEILEGIQKARNLSLQDPTRLAALAAHASGHAPGSPLTAIGPGATPKRTLPSPVPIQKRGTPVGNPYNPGFMMTTQNSSPDLRGSMPGPAMPPPAAAGAVEKLIFDIFRGAPSVAWSSFAVGFCHVFGNIPLQQIECLKPLITDDAGNHHVLRSKVERLLQWFAPVSIEGGSNYNTSQEAAGLDTGGYSLEMLLEVVGPTYFHGHLSPDQAQALLRDQVEGTYLFRFSSTPGAYTLSVSYHNVVGHWRIQCVKKTHEAPRFLIEHREYRSLQHIIAVHSQGGESLRVTRVVPGQPATCFLRNPLARAAEDEQNIYNA